jgi:hypothetical protein
MRGKKKSISALAREMDGDGMKNNLPLIQSVMMNGRLFHSRIPLMKSFINRERLSAPCLYLSPVGLPLPERIVFLEA